MMFGKVLVRLNRIRRDAYDLCAGRGVIFPAIANGTHLPSADRGFIARIEKQDNNLAAMVGQTPLGAVAVEQREIRRGPAFLGI
jgi:hypothetical protein